VAGILRLHREETYELPCEATPDAIVDSEVARRTFWPIQCMSFSSQMYLKFSGEIPNWGNGEEPFSDMDGGMGGIPVDNFEDDLSEFLQGSVNFGLMEGW
jgi:hypothetical protein